MGFLERLASILPSRAEPSAVEQAVQSSKGSSSTLPSVPINIDTTPTPIWTVGGIKTESYYLVESPVPTDTGRSRAAQHGHPAGSAHREDPNQYRRGAASRRQEGPPQHMARPYVRPPQGRDRRGEWFGGGSEQQGGMSDPPGRISNPNPPPGFRD